jgi:hypothetical protein
MFSKPSKSASHSAGKQQSEQAMRVEIKMIKKK